MKRVATALLIVLFELMVGTLFLVGLLHFRTDSLKYSVVDNNNLSKMADVVNVMFDNDTVEDVFLVNPVDKEDENKEEEQNKQKDDKEESLEEYKEEEPKVEEKKEEVIKKEEPVKSYVEEEPVSEVIKTYTGTLTGYGPDCSGCSGNTASGYYVGNTITYNDSTYGNVRIVAADKSIPFYSIVRISNVPGMDTITAIVLDTGGAVGFGKATLFDLLFASESATMNKAYNVKFEILRWGGA